MTIPIVYTDRHFLHNPSYEIYDGVKTPYAEKAERLTSIMAALKKAGYKNIQEPRKFPLDLITQMHQKQYISFLQKRSESLKKNESLHPSYFITDTYAPITNGTHDAAVSAVDVVLTAAELVQNGEPAVYAVCRPPGHHAEYKSMGGYCYFNNAAIAAEYLSKKGSVAILDIDYHHGNGTQSAFYDRSDVLYVSIHADPANAYPYISGFVDEQGVREGRGFNKNYPLPLGTNNSQYAEVLNKALADVHEFNPKYLVVSAGFDTYQHDPICGFRLTIPFYETMARAIAGLKLPTLIVQEGGYNVKDLGEIAVSFLKGFQKSE
mgnify:FL=1